jgi:hypothetical protein
MGHGAFAGNLAISVQRGFMPINPPGSRGGGGISNGPFALYPLFARVSYGGERPVSRGGPDGGWFNEAVNGYFICDRGDSGFITRPSGKAARRDFRGKPPYAEALRRAVETWGSEPGKRAESDRFIELTGPVWKTGHEKALKQGWRMPGFAETQAMANKVKAVLRLDARLAVSLGDRG